MALILVVDDEEQVREYIRHALSNDHMTIEAPTGLDALRFVRMVRPGLAIVDLHLKSKPEGPELCLILSENNDLVGMPILAISGQAAPAEISDVLISAGAVTFLDKPFTAEELTKAVTRLLDGSQVSLSRLLAVMAELEIVKQVRQGITAGDSARIIRALRAGIDLAERDLDNNESAG